MRVLSGEASEITKAMSKAELREQLTNIGYEQVDFTPREFALFVSAYIEKMREPIMSSGIRPGE